MKKLLSTMLLLTMVCMTSVMAKNTKVLMKTSAGEIELELFDDKAPISVKNFLMYVDKGFYKGTIFHRVIDGFMIQALPVPA